jgi:hypothetical protein
MTSRKRSAVKKQREEFEAGFGSLDGLFERAEQGMSALEAKREGAYRAKSCGRKNRYDTKLDAQDAIARSADRGVRGLTCYRCEFCGGWHLTSHGRA